MRVVGLVAVLQLGLGIFSKSTFVLTVTASFGGVPGGTGFGDDHQVLDELHRELPPDPAGGWSRADARWMSAVTPVQRRGELRRLIARRRVRSGAPRHWNRPSTKMASGPVRNERLVIRKSRIAAVSLPMRYFDLGWRSARTRRRLFLGLLRGLLGNLLLGSWATPLIDLVSDFLLVHADQAGDRASEPAAGLRLAEQIDALMLWVAEGSTRGPRASRRR